MKEAFTLNNSYKLVEEEFSTLSEDIKKVKINIQCLFSLLQLYIVLFKSMEMEKIEF